MSSYMWIIYIDDNGYTGDKSDCDGYLDYLSSNDAGTILTGHLGFNIGDRLPFASCAVDICNSDIGVI